MKKNKKVSVFLDSVDWQHEIGEAMGGNVIYPSLEDLKKNNPCWEACGVVKCKVTFEEWVVPQDIDRFSKGKSITVEELEKNPDLIRLEVAERRLEYLEKLVNNQKNKVINLKVNLKKGN